jgi:signal transduction histidine kinase
MESIEAAEAIMDAVDELIRTSDQARQFEGIIEGMDRTTEEIDLTSVLESLVTAVEKRCPGLTITLDAPASATVQAHETLELALTELLTLDHTGRIEVTVRLDGIYQEVRITDIDGCIDDHDLQVLTHRTESPLEHPYGLELWLVRWAVEYSGGEIALEQDGESPVIVVRLRSPSAESAA